MVAAQNPERRGRGAVVNGESRFEGSLSDRQAVSEYLASQGFTPAVADAKAGMFARNATALSASTSGQKRAVRAYWTPGRIEVLGKHTDYAGGSTLTAAAERGMCTVASARDDAVVEISDTRRRKSIRFSIGPELKPEAGHWPNYPMTVARRIARNFPGSVRGADIVFSSDLPSAAGMSSSSALLVSIYFALGDANDIWSHPDFPEKLKDPLCLAEYLGAVENGQSFETLAGDRGVGTFGGSEDHTAILCARAGQISQYSYCPVSREGSVPVPAGCTFAIAASGVTARKTGAALTKYNQAAELARRLAELWRRETGRSDLHLAAALSSDPGAAKRFMEIVRRSVADEEERRGLLNRLEHFITENASVLGAARALADGNLEGLGSLADSSQENAEQRLGNQTLETGFLAAAARRRDALAATAFGAGFGGSVWALIRSEGAERFLEEWRESYLAKFPEHEARAKFFLTGAGPSLIRLA
jgi:galactokinase